MSEDIQFLKELQKQLQYEDEYDYDCQASPRFWVLKDYRTVPANDEYDDGFVQYFYSDGDFVTFENFTELKEEVEEYHNYEITDSELLEIIETGSFELLWEYVVRNMNEYGCYSSCFVKEESFIVPNIMFLTKEEAKKHIELNHYHYTNKVHTYAMTAWRSPKVSKLLDVLMNFDWDSVKAELKK